MHSWYRTTLCAMCRPGDRGFKKIFHLEKILKSSTPLERTRPPMATADITMQHLNELGGHGLDAMLKSLHKGTWGTLEQKRARLAEKLGLTSATAATKVSSKVAGKKTMEKTMEKKKDDTSKKDKSKEPFSLSVRLDDETLKKQKLELLAIDMTKETPYRYCKVRTSKKAKASEKGVVPTPDLTEVLKKQIWMQTKTSELKKFGLKGAELNKELERCYELENRKSKPSSSRLTKTMTQKPKQSPIAKKMKSGAKSGAKSKMHPTHGLHSIEATRNADQVNEDRINKKFKTKEEIRYLLRAYDPDFEDGSYDHLKAQLVYQMSHETGSEDEEDDSEDEDDEEDDSDSDDEEESSSDDEDGEDDE